MISPEFDKRHPDYTKRIKELEQQGFRFVRANEWMLLKLPIGSDSTYMVNEKGNVKAISRSTATVSDYNTKSSSSNKIDPRP